MAEYTVELRDIISSGINIFDFQYDFYDEMKRREFEDKFIKHFYFREIGQETVDRFKFYLMDKMLTVFPYYNELFKSAQIEYDVLDNYKLTETYERTYENTGDSRATNNAVGRFNQEQTNTLDTSQESSTVGAVTSQDKTVTDTQGKSVTDSTNDGTSNTVVDSKTVTNSTENDKTDTTTTVNGSNESNDVKRHSDTPAGRLDLSEASYLSSLDHDIHSGSNTSSTVEDRDNVRTSNTTTNNDGTTDVTTHDKGNSETNETGKTTSTRNGQVDSTENLEANSKTNGTLTDEQISRNDSESRHLSESKHDEKYTLTRRGNIGVDTDSDAIEKHNRLQKTLRSIEKMFFDECEDLFMLVY